MYDTRGVEEYGGIALGGFRPRELGRYITCRVKRKNGGMIKVERFLPSIALQGSGR